jgi:hypothetical protein
MELKIYGEGNFSFKKKKKKTMMHIDQGHERNGGIFHH